MSKVNHLRSFVCFSLIFFLGLSVGSRILNQEGSGADHKGFTISGHSGIATAESQLPFEEKEEEKGQDDSFYNVDSAHFGFEPFGFTRAGEDRLGGVQCNDRSSLPIYLAKRALLI